MKLSRLAPFLLAATAALTAVSGAAQPTAPSSVIPGRRLTMSYINRIESPRLEDGTFCGSATAKLTLERDGTSRIPLPTTPDLRCGMMVDATFSQDLWGYDLQTREIVISAEVSTREGQVIEVRYSPMPAGR